MKPISNGWLTSAKSDIETIKAILENNLLTNVTAFHAQQCIEKCFKAIIEEYELPTSKIHNLITLYNNISKVKNFYLDEDLLGLLNKLYIDSRYPGEIGLLPNGKPTTEDARKFYEYAVKIYNEVHLFLSGYNSNMTAINNVFQHHKPLED